MDNDEKVEDELKRNIEEAKEIQKENEFILSVRKKMSAWQSRECWDAVSRVVLLRDSFWRGCTFSYLEDVMEAYKETLKEFGEKRD